MPRFLPQSLVVRIYALYTVTMLVFVGDPSFPLTMDTLAPLVLWPLALFYGGVVVPAPGGGGFIEGAFAATLSGIINWLGARPEVRQMRSTTGMKIATTAVELITAPSPAAARASSSQRRPSPK